MVQRAADISCGVFTVIIVLPRFQHIVQNRGLVQDFHARKVFHRVYIVMLLQPDDLVI